METRIAVVTGGSRGIGRAVAVDLAAHGYMVVITYRQNDEAAEESLRMIREAGGSAEAVKFDIASADETRQAMDDLLKRLRHVDALINNAGIAADGLFMTMSQGSWQRVIETNLNGFYNVTRPVLRGMIRRKKGTIVSLSSVSALVGNRGQANYAAAKAGIIAASRAIAAEAARFGVRINVVAPGAIETEMTKGIQREKMKELIPMGRLGRPEEVARVIRFLCSDDSSYITGQVLSVNGGMF
ncbi:MAG: 3-oxoacyl-ACP reductase FabG [Syntrophales bacterium]|jgi:3-oxoacyl-[acyl-carrier protein] reductase|nr:3-oxoacyl-ACP reductase FabG [Syntrophales bacterium]